MEYSICDVSENEHTFSEFFKYTILARIPITPEVTYELVSAELGPSKESLDKVDLNLQIIPVIESFGRFLKYYVKDNTTETVVTHAPHSVTSVNAFQILMDAQRQLQHGKKFPDRIVEKNKKDKLYNDILHLLISKNMSLKHSEISSFGERLIKALRDILWHIDGHHEAFSQQSTAVPNIFQAFKDYNCPEKTKHRKREQRNMSSDHLRNCVSELLTLLQANPWERENWREFKLDVSNLASSISGYVEYLSQKNKVTKYNHSLPVPVRELSSNLRLKLIPVSKTNSVTPSSLHTIEKTLDTKSCFEFVSANSLLPSNSMQKHRLIELLSSTGLKFPCAILMYAPGSNIGNLVFLWKLPCVTDLSSLFEQSQVTVENMKAVIPQYHTRAMRTAMFEKFGRISPSTKPSTLRYFYKELTGDQAAASTTEQEEVDQRILQIIDMEDPTVLHDLRALNSGQATKFDVFWEECGRFLNEDIGIAVDDRRHGEITHLARAISVRDLVEQVKVRCPSGTSIPSVEWTRLQFWPKTPAAKSSLHYTGKFKMKFMVQQRQWRRSHVDAHYAAAIFRYMREYALKLHEFCEFVCIDDKHKLKIGEPNCPVAAAERGRRVAVRANESLMVTDHDFTKFGLIPSVILLLDIPEEISGSWYCGKVFVSLKDSVFEPSSPLRHACELYGVLRSTSFSKSVLFLYSDGGPDHRLTYVSVQLSLICLFRKLDLDFLCAGRTAPYHSWHNPVERIMSILNLGLQCVGLAREKMPEDYEKEVTKCNNLTQLRKIAERTNQFKGAVKDSLSPVKILLCNIFSRLQLKAEPVQTFTSATTEEISEFWSVIIAIDDTLEESNKYIKANISEHTKISEFIDHCCRMGHYTFDILKCGKENCKICKPVNLPRHVFDTIKHLPFPMPGSDGHYLSFSDVLSKETSEEHRPSFKKKPSNAKKKTLPFYASVQHVKNSQLMVQCEECNMWRLVFSKHKLTIVQRQKLQAILEGHSYSCGAKLSELELNSEFKDVEIRDHACGDTIEKLYYSAGLEPICVYCGVDHPFTSESQYPQCENCSHLPAVKK